MAPRRTRPEPASAALQKTATPTPRRLLRRDVGNGILRVDHGRLFPRIQSRRRASTLLRDALLPGPIHSWPTSYFNPGSPLPKLRRPWNATRFPAAGPHGKSGLTLRETDMPSCNLNSRMPSRMVVRDKPVALATQLMPPQANSMASAAAHWRRMRSSITIVRAWNFLRILSIAAASMQLMMHKHHKLAMPI